MFPSSARNRPSSSSTAANKNNSNSKSEYPSTARIRAPARPPTSIWYHELENPEEAFVLPFFRYVIQLQRNAVKRDNEWFLCNGVGGGAGMSARSVKSQDAKLSAPHYVLEATRQRQIASERRRNQSPEQRESEEKEKRMKQQSLAMSQMSNAAFLQAAQSEKNLTARKNGQSHGSYYHRASSNSVASGSVKMNLNSSINYPAVPPSPFAASVSSFPSGIMNHENSNNNNNNNNGRSPSRVLVKNPLIENSIQVKPIPARIPDTVIFMRRMPRGWFTYDEDAKMALRLPPLSLDTVKIFDHFSTVAPNSDGICALYFTTTTGKNPSLVVEPMRPKDLQEFLGGRPSILDRCPDGALQKYIPTNGKSNTMYEVMWSPSSCGVYPTVIDSIKELPAAAIRSEKDIASSGGITGLTVAHLHDEVFGMIGYFIHDLLRSERRKIIRFSGLFRVDNEQKVWLVGATSVRCAPMNEPINNAIPRMPVGMLRPAPFHAPRLDLTTPTLIVGRPPPERPPETGHSTEHYHPFFFTPLHITKPFATGTSAIDVAAAALPRDLLYSALEHEHELMHFVRETDAFLGSEPVCLKPKSSDKNSKHNNAADSREASFATMKYSNRGASLRFKNQTRLMNADKLFSKSANQRNAGDGDEEENEEKVRRREFDEKLKEKMNLVREFAKSTAEFMTATLLDALSGGLSLNMKNDEWTSFVGTIVLELDERKWREKLTTIEDRRVISDSLELIGCVGYPSSSSNSNNDNEKDGLQAAAPPVFCFDKLEQPIMEFGPASELNLLKDPSDRDVTPSGISVAAAPRLGESKNSKFLRAAITRSGKRTITGEATEWLWKLQRTFEDNVAERISEAEAIHKEKFNAQLYLDVHQRSGPMEAEEEIKRLHGIEQENAFFGANYEDDVDDNQPHYHHDHHDDHAFDDGHERDGNNGAALPQVVIEHDDEEMPAIESPKKDKKKKKSSSAKKKKSATKDHDQGIPVQKEADIEHNQPSPVKEDKDYRADDDFED